LFISVGILAPDVIQELPAPADKAKQSPPGVKILLMECQVFCQVSDSPREKRDLHLRRAGIGLMSAVLPNDLVLVEGLFGHEAVTSFLLK
jgi:hypothetical protein